MFILNSQDVEYCQTTTQKLSRQTIYYRGFFFNKVWNTNDTQAALKFCRQFLDLNKPLTSIIVKHNDNFTVWVEVLL